MKQIKPVHKVKIDDKDISGTVERLASSVSKSVDSIIQSSIISGYVLENVDLTTSAARIEHKLGRAPLGYIVVRRDANAVVYEQEEERPDLFLNLVSSASVRVSLWIF